MASPVHSRYPSIRSMTVAELLNRFRSSINRGALQALEERDAYWISEIDVLRAHCCKQEAESVELLRRINWIEEELSENGARLQRKIRSLKQEKADLEAKLKKPKEKGGSKFKPVRDEVCNVKRKKKRDDEMRRFSESKMDLEAENRRLKAVEKELNLRIEGLEKEKEEIEAELCKKENEKKGGVVMIERMEDKVKALKDEGIQLVHNIDVLKREKRDMELKFRKKGSVKSAETDVILNEKRSLEVLIQGMKEEVSQLAGKNEVLEMEKSAGIVVKKRTEDEVKALKDESIELVHNIDVLKREKRDMEIEFRKKESAKSGEIDMVLNEKRSLEVLIQGMKEEISQLANKNEVLEMEKGEIEAELCRTLHEKVVLGDLKSRMEAELKEKISQLVDEIGVLEKERAELGMMKEEKLALEEQKRRAEESVKVLEKGKKALDDEFYGYRKERRAAMEEKNKLIKKITQEKTGLEAELRKVVKDSDRKMSKWIARTEALVRTKDDMEAEMWKAKNHKVNESEKISKLKEALEDQKTHLEDAERRISNFLKTVEVLEREKKAWNVKEREKGGEINSILKEKMDMEAEMRTLKEEDHKKILKLFHMIEVLKREKMEMKSELCQGNKEKDEEIKRILNENVAIKAEKTSLKEEGEKKILELAARIGILEREKRGLDEEIVQKDEVIQVLAQENDSLEDMKKKLRMEINGLASKLKKTANLFQPVHHPSNVDMLRTPLQNEGKKSLGNCKRKRTNTDACKRKRHSSEDSSGDIGNSSSHVTEDLASCRRTRPTMWETDQDLLDALDGDPELCLEAICALYRQRKSLQSSKPTNSPLSLGVRGSKPDYSSKVIALAEYLIDEDPEGRMKKSVTELEQLDPAAVGECTAIAKQHYKQVFEIFKNKESPFFLS